MAEQAIQTFDGWQPIIVNPSEIRPGDFMRDLGRLREVESVETFSGPCAQGVSVRFVGGTDGRYASLSVPELVQVTGLAFGDQLGPCSRSSRSLTMPQLEGQAKRLPASVAFSACICRPWRGLRTVSRRTEAPCPPR